MKRYQQQLEKASGSASGITRLEKNGAGREEFREQWSFLANGHVFPEYKGKVGWVRVEEDAQINTRVMNWLELDDRQGDYE